MGQFQGPKTENHKKKISKIQKISRILVFDFFHF